MDMQAAMAKAQDLKFLLTERIESRKGDKRSTEGTQLQRREQLEIHGAIPNHEPTAIALTIVPEAYSPSLAPLSTLMTASLADLCLETHHYGKVLLLRTFGYSTSVSEIQTFMPVEDETGDVDRIAIFNFGLASWPEQQLPSGAVLAIKDPFYCSINEDLSLALCIHHPSDMVFLEEDHPMYPSIWKLPAQMKTANEWKLDGNNALEKKDYIKANRCYTKGLAAVAPADNELRSNLLRNRAQTRLSIGCYEAAKADAIASIVNLEVRDCSNNRDALYLAGRAAYELQDYKHAQKLFDKLLSILSYDIKGLTELHRTNSRIQEAEQGVFDFAAMLRKIADTANYYMDQASYVRDTSISNGDNQSKGLFAKKDFVAGDIILCEKPFVASVTSEKWPALSVIINPTNGFGMHGSLVAIWIDAVRKSFHNPSSSRNIIDLYENLTSFTASATESRPAIVDDMPVIDVFHLRNIVEHKSFAFLADKGRAHADLQKTVRLSSCGIWTRAAHMNHSCLSNSSRAFVGDFVIVRASKDISQGDEITTTCCDVDGNFDQLKQDLENRGLSCSCRLCKAESECDGSRSSLMLEVKSFLKVHSLKEIVTLGADKAVPADSIETAKRLEMLLEESYPSDLFVTCVPETTNILELLPAMGMAELHIWLMMAHYHEAPLALEYARSVLSDHGYHISLYRDSDIVIDRSSCVPSTRAVWAMQYIEMAYKKADRLHLAAAARVLAEEMHVTSVGNMVDYKNFMDHVDS